MAVSSRYFRGNEKEMTPTRRSRYSSGSTVESPRELRHGSAITNTATPSPTHGRQMTPQLDSPMLSETVGEKIVLVSEVQEVSSPTSPSKSNRSPRSKRNAVAKPRKKVTLQLVSLRTHHDRNVAMIMRLVLVKPFIVQSILFHRPEWLLVATILLNVTSGKAAVPVLNEVRTRWPTMEALSQAHAPELELLLTPLGLGRKRTQRLIQFATMWLEDPPDQLSLRPSRVQVAKGVAKYPPTAVSHLPGMGRYALDSYRIFCGQLVGGNEWKTVTPLDKELRVHMVSRLPLLC